MSRSARGVTISSAKSSDQLVERAAFPPARLLEAFLRALPGARDRVENLRDALRLGIGVVERGGEERTRQRSLLHMTALGEHRQLVRVLLVERQVDPACGRSHAAKDTRSATGRVGDGASRCSSRRMRTTIDLADDVAAAVEKARRERGLAVYSADTDFARFEPTGLRWRNPLA